MIINHQDHKKYILLNNQSKSQLTEIFPISRDHAMELMSKNYHTWLTDAISVIKVSWVRTTWDDGRHNHFFICSRQNIWLRYLYDIFEYIGFEFTEGYFLNYLPFSEQECIFWERVHWNQNWAVSSDSSSWLRVNQRFLFLMPKIKLLSLQFNREYS